MINLTKDTSLSPIRVGVEVPTQYQDGGISLAYNDCHLMRMFVRSQQKDTQGMAYLDINLEQVIELRDGLTALIDYSQEHENPQKVV